MKLLAHESLVILHFDAENKLMTAFVGVLAYICMVAQPHEKGLSKF